MTPEIVLSIRDKIDSYRDRVFHSLKGGLLLYVIVAVFGINLDFLILSTVIIVLFVKSYFEASIWCRFHVFQVELAETFVMISYLDKDNNKLLEIPRDKFSIKLRSVWYAFRTPVYYLELKESGKTVCKQFELDGISRQVVKTLKDRFAQPLTKNKFNSWPS